MSDSIQGLAPFSKKYWLISSPTGRSARSRLTQLRMLSARKPEELQAEKEELRELIAGFLEDDVITADELAQLPEDHIFNDLDGPFAEALADGELTKEELASIKPHPKRDAFRHGVRFGALLDDGGIDQAEYDALPDDHPFKQIDVSEYLADGVITIDELRQIRQSQDSGDAA